ncbi:SPOR domain-containing protein [Pontibacter indicus]|uniref:Sporulation related domain-containing protein n=1 Tax=Pontibacter indicus TaxID=1317125 RepID=A0A1R3WSM4_9BACT|nr:SPOR domain-containing protein [Pontibacter indicus]SIT81295.1 Sporulation related domain-containing protein [Pontibacter indicus]
MVEKHIKHLLYNHDCVIIPDFGGLITRYVPARINPVKHTLVPPSKKIAFNEKLVLNDGLLISTIAYANNSSKEEARQLVISFVHEVRTRLESEQRYELTDIGVFKYNHEQRLVFEYTEGDNLLEASFGLPEIVARPIRPEEPAVLRTLIKERQAADTAPAKKPFKVRLKRAYHVAAGLALTGLVGTALYMLSLQTDYNLSTLNPISLISGDRQAETEKTASAAIPVQHEATLGQPASNDVFDAAEAGIADSSDAWDTSSISTSGQEAQYAADESVNTKEAVVEEAPAPAPLATTVSGKDGRFYIITGGYARMLNAEFSRQEIAEFGHEAKVLEPGKGSRLFKVSVADFASAEEAQAAMNTYRKSFGENIWVYNN